MRRGWLSASYFSLIVPGIDAAAEQYGSTTIAALIAAGGIALGALVVAIMNEMLPHEHFIEGKEGRDAQALAKIWLFVIAITIHNFPEGMAVGISFGGGNIANGMSLATGIGLQNAPEGLAVAVALRGHGYSKVYAFGIATIQVSCALLPWGLTFAAGAMLYVISHEIIPETHRHGYQNAATTGLTIGLS